MDRVNRKTSTCVGQIVFLRNFMNRFVCIHYLPIPEDVNVAYISGRTDAFFRRMLGRDFCPKLLNFQEICCKNFDLN